jgi:6-pyruvoyltetrahydropterin/6-carboxytetrahydropterin synthase
MSGSRDNEFSIRVTKDTLVFSAAHFITYNGNVCERLHGHNWRLAVDVFGPLDENHYVFDFIALRDAMQEIVNRLDHRVLLPTEHAQIRVVADQREVTAAFEERRWVFPREDCILLPVANTTAERIAQWIGCELRTAVFDQAAHPLTALEVHVEENFGQWARCRMELST